MFEITSKYIMLSDGNFATWYNYKSDTMKEKATITLRLESETKEIIDLISSVKGISTNEYLNQLITDKVSEIEPATLTEIKKLRNL